jgi:copper homeostasis protein
MPLLEVCVDSLESLDAAQAGGADRIELCARLDQGGLSPWPELLKAARARARLTMHVMVRSRAGDYVYSWDELEDMAQQVEELKALKVGGLVFGALTAENDVAREMTEEIVRLAAPLPVDVPPRVRHRARRARRARDPDRARRESAC